MDKDHVSKLEKFIENVNSNDNSHFISIEPGPGCLEDKLIGKIILLIFRILL